MCKENEDNSRLRKIYVGGLAWKTTSDDLRRYFQQFGEVVEANVVCDSSGRSKGFGFVEFKDDESVARALENRNPIIDGRTTNCNMAHTKNHHTCNFFYPKKKNHHKQKGSSNNHAEPSHRYQPSSQQASTSQQHQPNSQYCPSIVWDPISSQYYYVYGNRFDSYTNSMILYQDWINMMLQDWINTVRFEDDESAARALENRNPIINGRTTNCNLAHTKNQHNQKGSSKDHAEPSHRYQPNSQQASTTQQHQPNSQYRPSIVWDPFSSQHYYVYDNRFDSYTNSMILYQNWINLAQQNHANTNTDQQNNVVVNNNQDVITIVDGDLDDQEKIEVSDHTDEEENGNVKQDEEDSTKEVDEEAVEEEEVVVEDFKNLSFSNLKD